MGQKEIEEYKGFRVGDLIRIIKRPSTWSSAAGGRSPIHSDKIEYPFLTSIKKMVLKHEGTEFEYVSMLSSEGWGWTFSDLVKNNSVEIAAKKEAVWKTGELVPLQYYKVTCTSDPNFIMIGQAKMAGGFCTDGKARGLSTYIFPGERNFAKNKSWCYLSPTRRVSVPTDREILWLKACIKEDKFIPYEDFKKNMYKSMYGGEGEIELTKFPSEGHCMEYNEDLLNFLESKSKVGLGIKYKCRQKGNCGVAWRQYGGTQGWNAWPIKNSSSKPEYSIKQLEKFFPTFNWDIPKYPDKLSNSGAKSNKIELKDTVSADIENISMFPDSDGTAKILTSDKDYISEGDNPFTAGHMHDRITAHAQALVDSHRTSQRVHESSSWAREQKFAYQAELEKVKLNKEQIDKDMASLGLNSPYNIENLYFRGTYGHKKRDEFEQQEPVIMKRKKGKRTLIIS